MRYLNEKRRRLGGRELEQPVREQSPGAVQKQPIPAPRAVQTTAQRPQAQTQTAAPKAVEEPTQTQTAPATQTSAPAQAGGQDAVTAAQNLLNQQLGSYQSQYGGQIDSLLQQLQGQQPFEYDVNTDPLYLQLRDQWMRDGKLAMEDTMGQAAQLTGGYGNSYAQTAGQQVYNAHLRGLTETVPQLKEAARADYDSENAYLMQQLGLLMDQDSQDYSRWMDELNRQRYEQEWQYQLERDALADQRYEDEWAYQQDRDALADQRYQDELAYGREQDDYARQQEAYDQLVTLIATTGYQPTAEELAAAGMTEAEAKAWRKYWSGNQAVGGSGGGGYRTSSTKRTENDGTGDDDDEQSPQQHNVYTREELGDPFKKEDYVTVYANCTVSVGNGAPASERAAYIKKALNSGAITQAQYETLMAKFCDQYDTGPKTGQGYGRGGSGGNGGGGQIRKKAHD